MAERNTPEWIAEQSTVLRAASDPSTLEASAIALASADDPAALDALAPFLADGDFLARLDDLQDPTRKTMRLGQVLTTLLKFPSPEIVPLCRTLAHSPEFLADPDRKIFLLQALSVAAPMDADTVAIFAYANTEGYFASNACLLAHNASPPALSLLTEMMLDDSVDVDLRVSVLHESVVPNRNRIPIIEFVGRLVAKQPPPEIVNAAVESLYDFQTIWRRGHPQPPPAWRTSSTESLRYLVNMAAALRKRFAFPEHLQQAIHQTVRIAEAILARRDSA